MTSPVTTEALVEALARDIDGSAFLPAHQDGRYYRIRREDALRRAEAFVAGPLAPLLTSLQQVTAERDEARKENDRFRAGTANGSGPCAYCNLSREDWTKCRSGFPGCDRADDAMLCPHFGGEMEANDRADTATAEVAALRTEVEALKAALKEIAEHPESYADGQTSYAVGWAFWNIQAIARTTLARAATQEGK